MGGGWAQALARVSGRYAWSGLPPIPGGSGSQPDHLPPLWHSVLPFRVPNLWAKVTAPAVQGTCDHMSTAELKQATQSGHCAKHAGPLAKPCPIPSLPELWGP